MQKLLLGYRDNMRVEIEPGVPVTAKTVADLRALPTWPDGTVLNIHIDLDPRLSVVRVERASWGQEPMSALALKADIPEGDRHVRSVPIADMSLQRLNPDYGTVDCWLYNAAQ